MCAVPHHVALVLKVLLLKHITHWHRWPPSLAFVIYVIPFREKKNHLLGLFVAKDNGCDNELCCEKQTIKGRVAVWWYVLVRVHALPTYMHTHKHTNNTYLQVAIHIMHTCTHSHTCE